MITDDKEAGAAPTITPAEIQILRRLLAGAGAESGARATAAQMAAHGVTTAAIVVSFTELKPDLLDRAEAANDGVADYCTRK